MIIVFIYVLEIFFGIADVVKLLIIWKGSIVKFKLKF